MFIEQILSMVLFTKLLTKRPLKSGTSAILSMVLFTKLLTCLDYIERKARF